MSKTVEIPQNNQTIESRLSILETRMDSVENELGQCVRFCPVDESIDSIVGDLLYTTVKEMHDRTKPENCKDTRIQTDEHTGQNLNHTHGNTYEELR